MPTTREQFAVIAARIRRCYPREVILQDAAAIETWYDLLCDLDADTLTEAVKRWAAHEKWSPTVADLRELCIGREEETLTDAMAWAMVKKALKNGGSGYNEEFAKLPRSVQMAIGSPWELHCWAMDEHWNEAAMRKMFTATFNRVHDSEVKESRVPEHVRKAFKAAQNRMLGNPDTRAQEILQTAEKQPETKYIEPPRPPLTDEQKREIEAFKRKLEIYRAEKAEKERREHES